MVGVEVEGGRGAGGELLCIRPARAGVWALAAQDARQRCCQGGRVFRRDEDTAAVAQGARQAIDRGVLVPAEDPPALAAALSRVLGGERPDPGPGRAYARQFTPRAVAALYLDAYHRLLASRTRSGQPGPATTPATSSHAAIGTPHLSPPQKWSPA